MRPAFPAVIAAVLVTALPGCSGPLLFAELQVKDVRITLPEQAFPASDFADPATWCALVQDPTQPCIQQTLDYDLGGPVPILDDPNVTYDLRLKDVAIILSASQAGTNLTGVKYASLQVLADPLDPSSGTVIASYVRPPGAVPSRSIGVTGNSNLDLGPYLEAGKLPVRVEVTFDGSTPAFLADVAAGFSLEVKLDWGSLL
jgi:hypothetical protein